MERTYYLYVDFGADVQCTFMDPHLHTFFTQPINRFAHPHCFRHQKEREQFEREFYKFNATKTNTIPP